MTRTAGAAAASSMAAASSSPNDRLSVLYSTGRASTAERTPAPVPVRTVFIASSPARHTPPGEDHVHRVAVTDQPGQTHRAEVDQRHAPAPAEDAEDGVGGRHAEVAPERQLEATRDGVALDRGEDGLREQHARRS